MIPLPRMGEYTDGIERINIELSAWRTSWRWSTRLEAFFLSGIAAARQERRRRRDRLGGAAGGPRAAGAGGAARGGGRWRGWLADLDRPVGRGAGAQRLRAAAGPHPARLVEDADPRAAAVDLRRRGVQADRRRMPAASTPRCCKGRVWVALHMHAGDGNVHTNIPVNSDNYEMLQTAHRAVARIMGLARSLDGVISGEHGIGITKLEFLTDDELADFTDYKQRVDPEGRFNKGKLLRGAAARPKARPAPCRPEQRLHAELRPDGPRVADHAAERHRRDRQLRSRTACAAASASRCAPPTCRAPTCCTARATRSSPPRCWSRPSCTRSRRGAASRSSTGRSSRTWPTTAPSATSA